MEFFKKTKLAFTTLSIVLLSSDSFACSVCFTQVEDDPQAIGLKWAVLTLLAIVLIVLGFSGKFIWDITRREKMLMNQNIRKS